MWMVDARLELSLNLSLNLSLTAKTQEPVEPVTGILERGLRAGEGLAGLASLAEFRPI
jgi:hypothetical protein